MASWQITADYIQNCNCDWGCPCNFNAPPTTGKCEGVAAVHVLQGNLDNARLDGMDVVLVMVWPGQIHEGNGTLQVYFDPRTSTPEQREAFLTIGSGQAGGLPFSILASTFTNFKEPRLAPIEIVADGERSHFRVDDAVEVEVEPMHNPVTGNTVYGSVVIPNGFIFDEAPVYSNKKMEVDTGDIRLSYPDKNAHVCVVKWHGP